MRADPPFGTFAPRARFARLIDVAQRAPANALGQQLAQAARSLYLWRAPSPTDVTVGELRLRCWLHDNTCERKFVFTPWRYDVRELCVDAGNLGGGSLAGGNARFSRAGSATQVSIECRPLLHMLTALGLTRVDALKIDIEGTEDAALCPYLGSAPGWLLPRRVVVENSDALWKQDLRGALTTRGYQLLFRTRLNSVYDLAGGR